MKKEIRNEKIREYKKLIFFLLLFFINIGAKELYRFYSEDGFVTYVILFLSFLSTIMIFPKKNEKYIRLYFISFVLYIFLVISSFSSIDVEYGLQKAYLGLLLPLTIYFFFNKKDWKTEEVLGFLIIAVLIIDFIAIFMKMRYGFWDRFVSFGLLGPIPFGWVNGMAFLGTLFTTQKEFKKIFLALFFLAMILWTGSKGPLVGLIILGILFFYKFFKKRNKSSFFVLLAIIITVTYIIINYGEDVRSIRMLVEFFDSPDEYMEGVGRGSFGSRFDNYKYSLILFQDNLFFGVGFGGWQGDYMNMKYPHNILFELSSETGIFGIGIFLIFLSQLKYNNIVSKIGLFACITLMFSGDFSYFRYALYPLLISLNIKDT